MARYALRRAALALPVLAGILALAFVIVHLFPGDPVFVLAGEYGDAAYYAEMRAKFGLDRSLPEQFIVYASAVLHGDLGTSFVHRQAVASVVGSRIGPTLLLAGTALLLSTTLGVGIGMAAARRSGSLTDAATNLAGLVLYSVPVFWAGQLLLILFALHLPILPVQGIVSVRAEATGLAYVADVAQHLVLPATALGLSHVALIARLTRSGMRRALAEEYATTARAKGLPDNVVARRHALPNALLPVVTVVGAHVGTLLAGALLVEVVFGWPGLGRLMFESITTRDYPVLMTLFMLISASVALANLATDLAYAVLDPRVRLVW